MSRALEIFVDVLIGAGIMLIGVALNWLLDANYAKKMVIIGASLIVAAIVIVLTEAFFKRRRKVPTVPVAVKHSGLRVSSWVGSLGRSFFKEFHPSFVEVTNDSTVRAVDVECSLEFWREGICFASVKRAAWRIDDSQSFRWSTNTNIEPLGIAHFVLYMANDLNRVYLLDDSGTVTKSLPNGAWEVCIVVTNRTTFGAKTLLYFELVNDRVLPRVPSIAKQQEIASSRS